MMTEWSNHVWQSTVFAIAAALFTLAFRGNRAQIRYWLWLSASFKFLLPFSLLIAAGTHMVWVSPATRSTTPYIPFAMAEFSEPFTTILPPTAHPHNAVGLIFAAAIAVWACGFVVIGLVRIRGWLRIRAAVRCSMPIDIPAVLEIRSCPGLLEPGVVGLHRPVLLLPAAILKSLSPQQLEAVLAHELCHVRRHHNLFASIHMLVLCI